MHKILIILISCLIFCSNIHAQNLVPDPSFEIYKKKYKDRKFKLKTEYWSSPTSTTPDLLSPYNLRKDYQAPKNQYGYQVPKQGDTYVGIVVYRDDTRYQYQYREYIETELTEALIPGKMYCISMYVSLSDLSIYASDGIDLLMLVKRHNNNRGPIWHHKTTIENIGGAVVKDSVEWVLISDVFIADDYYKYLVVGNMRDYEDNRIVQVREYKRRTHPPAQRYTYYYIDNISLIEISDSSECPCYSNISTEETTKVIRIEKPKETVIENYILENIYFETDKAVLLNSSSYELDRMYNILSNNDSCNIVIEGYTDNVGEEEHNYLLSIRRAEAVYEYFLARGIPKDRMKYVGYGSKNNIASNNTAEGRRKNRRVEIKLMKID